MIQRIRQEMETVGFDRVEIDPMGNVLGYIGNGSHLIAMDAHIDTVDVAPGIPWQFGSKSPDRAARYHQSG